MNNLQNPALRAAYMADLNARAAAEEARVAAQISARNPLDFCGKRLFFFNTKKPTRITLTKSVSA